MLTLAKNGEIRTNVDYYAVGHSSAFVPRGALFMPPASIDSDQLAASGYVNGNEVIIVIQARYWDAPRDIALTIDGATFIIPQVGKEASVTFRVKRGSEQ